MKKTIFAISGSLRGGSSNTQLLKLFGIWLPDSINYNIYDGMGNLPHFIPTSEDEPLPDAVLNLHQQLNAAAGILICTPEYAFGVPGALKNLLDWTVATGNFVDKPVGVITASSQGNYAHPSLLTTLGALSANVIDGANLLVPFIRAKIDAEGNITDEGTEQNLRLVITNLLAAIA
jgi:chromate reductase